jgi:hypothetical protein
LTSNPKSHPQSSTGGLKNFQPAYPRYNLLYLQDNTRLSTVQELPLLIIRDLYMLLFKGPRDQLLFPLQSVCGIVEKRHTLPILSNVLMEKDGEKLTLSGYGHRNPDHDPDSYGWSGKGSR